MLQSISIYDCLFEIQIMIANTFNGVNPIRMRYEKGIDVLRVANRIFKRTENEMKNNKNKFIDSNGDTIIRRPATSWV